MPRKIIEILTLMNNEMKFLKTVCIVFILNLPIVLLHGEENKDEKYKQIFTKEKAFKDIAKNVFHIQGKVVDENGKPLNNVTLEVEKSISLGFLGSKDSSYKKTINSQFDIEEKNCSVVHLYFSKQGYYKVYKPITHRLLKDHQADIKNLKITMMTVGEKAKHKTRAIVLRYLPGKTNDIYDVISFKEKEIAGDGNKNIPLNNFYLDIKRDANGKYKTYNYRGIQVPEIVTLNLNCKDKDGIIVVRGENDVRNLRLAPENGYIEKSISFSSKDDVFNNNIVFYFKLGNTFGKGRVGKLFVSKNGQIKVLLDIMKNLEKDPKKIRIVSGKTH